MTNPKQQPAIRPAIVIPAYRRPVALKRLLRSVAQAHYPDPDHSGPVPVILSLDAGSSDDVKRIAHNFSKSFPYGNVRVIEHEQKLGLRNHIQWCGDQTESFDAVIVLEDDLYVDPWFYQFSQKALAEYQDQEYFGGVSLYSPRFNEFADLPFEPLMSGYDTFFMQSGSSSGQIWTRKSWQQFRAFMDRTGETELRENDQLPDWVRFIWPESSWKKYYNAWLVEQNLYMIYPCRSYSTNCSDPDGAHLQKRTSLHQSPVADPGRKADSLHFAPFDTGAICYDAFLEITGPTVQYLLGLDPSDIVIDLHGIKPESLIKRKKKVITSKRVRKSEASYPLMFRPVEQNLLHPDEDHTEAFFHLANTEDVKYASRLPGNSYFRLAEYYLRFSPFKSRFVFGVIKGYFRELRRLFGRKISKVDG